MTNISSLLILFILMPLVLMYMKMSMLTMMITYLYLGVIVMFIMMSMMLLNVKLSTPLNMSFMLLIMVAMSPSYTPMIQDMTFSFLMSLFAGLLILMYFLSSILIESNI